MNDAPRSDKKIALVTGANRGLGYATAQILGDTGFTVLIGSRNSHAGEHAAERLRADGIDAHAVHLDVTSETSVRKAAADIASEHGWLDVLVNNAGILPEATTPDIEHPLDLLMFKESFDTNVSARCLSSRSSCRCCASLRPDAS